MSRWNEKLKEHPIHNTLNQALSLINNKPNDADSAFQSEQRRLKKLINFFKSTINKLDGELISFDILDQLNSAIRNQDIWVHFSSFHSRKEEQHLIDVNDKLNEVILKFSQLLVFAEKAKLSNPLKDLEESFDNFTETIASKKTILEDDINEQSTLLERQNEKLDQLSQNLDSSKKEINELLATWQKQHSDSENIRTTEFNSTQQSKNNEFSNWKKTVEEEANIKIKTLIETSTDNLNNSQSAFDEKISNILNDASQKHNDILELHGLVAGDSVAAGYLKNAEDERKQANNWRVITIVFIVLIASFALFSYNVPFFGYMEEILWIRILKFASLTGALLFGASYSAKQSNLHRNNEIQARKFALEVKAIDPFISSLSEENQKELKNKFSDRLFAQQPDSIEKDNSIIDLKAFEVLIKGITDILRAK